MQRQPAAVAGQLIAGAHVSSVSKAVEGCIWTLAATGAATASVSVAVSLASLSITVVLNGEGLRERILLDLQRDVSAHSATTFLASLGQVCAFVTVSSRHSSESTTRCVRYGLHHQGPLWMGGDAPRCAGTSVRAQSLFAALPVRQHAIKARAPVEWEALRMCVAQYALASPNVGVTLRDADTQRTLVSVGACRAAHERLMQLYGGSSVDVALHSSAADTIEAGLYVVRGVSVSSNRVQHVQVNGIPIADAEWLVRPLVHGLASVARGPTEMGAPRTSPVLLLQLRCPVDEVEFLSNHGDTGAGIGCLFSKREAIAAAVHACALQLGVTSLRPLQSSFRACHSVPRTLKPSSARATPKAITSTDVGSPVVRGSPVLRTSAAASPPPPRTPNSSSPSDAIRELIASWVSPALQHDAGRFMPAPASPQQPVLNAQQVRLERRHLQGALRVVGQVQSKVIVVLLNNRVLVAFDQHAVSERIILEGLLASLGDCSAVAQVARSEVVPLVPMQADAALRWRQRLLPWWSIADDAGGVRITSSAVPCEHGHLTADDMLEYLHDLVESQGAQRMPRAVERLLAFRACRSAFKFGDALSAHQISALIAQLARCEFPFQCAHGRQSCMVLAVI